ncbi:Lipase [Nesidiocoris tenuis]|uniref:Lipase n=1 Tax=Nesidiocoris tenuis TaxID=355587 RepID=A0ABN7ART9_9HEMI|nr:Lipase [Nesidiocoris tenuis]
MISVIFDVLLFSIFLNGIHPYEAQQALKAKRFIKYDPDLLNLNDQFVHFWLYTQATPNIPKISTLEDPKLFGGLFNALKSTIILIPGFNNTPRHSDFFDTMKNAYIPAFDVNLITVFWDAAILQYPTARSKVPNVATIVDRFLKRMVREESLNLATLTVVGHSLGAQIAGTAGRLFKGKLWTVVGLDPASPLFKPGGPDTIDRRSAFFVQIIHTCGTFEGMIDPVGDVDFYPNGGLPPQPGCENADNPTSCSHARAFELYAETVSNPVLYPATRCSSYSKYLQSGCSWNSKDFMGQNSSRRARGMYYLRTDSEPPYRAV